MHRQLKQGACFKKPVSVALPESLRVTTKSLKRSLNRVKTIYTSTLGLVLGFHGCDQALAEDIVSGRKQLRRTKNDYDWLGHGFYFWENNPSRALEFARLLKEHPKRAKAPINNPGVLGQ